MGTLIRDNPDHHRVTTVTVRDSPRTYQRPPALAAFRPWGIQRDDTARGVTPEVTRPHITVHMVVTPRAVIRRRALMGNLPHGGFA